MSTRTTDIVLATWRKSSYSGQNGGQCVEIAELRPTIAVRDSKNPAGGVLAFGSSAWSTFLATTR